ncbi:DUF58 domain-containing protein [Myceligenerans pegani]|uniref:DUF58 domain-containing protein n=1 Tax=Myceligenerans pegani TaxID=2776917 RepID=A0ABR9MV74_9MICO|nr:DUF58 domain-containing protein [Myceligenerans sp. TRM 65318]MBE1874911.1 DUF58 domain-containing protein [Myceligenerans sp. TRM 65318]MBE3017182.1 DUF58 domain-containing protein [Myceligenerans sp. TRM 65318]
MTPPQTPPAWTATTTRRAGLVTGVVLLAAATLAARPDIALLAVPVLLTTLWSGTGPRQATTAHLHEPDGETRAGELTATLTLHPATHATLTHLRVTAPGHRETQTVLATPHPRDIPLRLTSVRTGPQDTFDIALRAYDTTGVWEQPQTDLHARPRLVLPGTTPLGPVPLPDALRGLTGPHTSRRLGDGTELRDIHPFRPGDRLRRIDWRATARRSPDLDHLYVRRTHATAEATAMLVLDSRDDVGPDIRTWRGHGTRRRDEATSLDLARHAAASIARQLLETGDRVAMEDLARRRRPVPPASGRRHLRRLTHGLALAHPVSDRAASHTLRPPQIPAGAIVYLFTTLLDDDTTRLVHAWRTLGHPVVVIDTLPALHPIHLPHHRIAWRITRLERDDRITALRRSGTPVVHWAGHTTAARTRLHALARTHRRRPAGRTT